MPPTIPSPRYHLSFQILLATAWFSTLGFLPAAMKLGQNLDAVSYHSTAPAFANSMKMASPWMTVLSDGNATYQYSSLIPSRSDGCPQYIPFSSPAGMLRVMTLVPIYEDGVHRLRVTGSGTLFIDAPGFYSKTFVVNGSAVIDIPVSGSNRLSDPYWQTDVPALRQEPSTIVLRIESSSSGDPLRNFVIMRPGYLSASEHAFDSELLAHLSGVSVIRLMDWQRTNNSPRTAFHVPSNSRNYYTQATNDGVAADYLFDLAQAVGADLWICVPHKMTDQGIRDMATHAASRLPAGRKLYVEYTNEHWNTLFEANSYISSQSWAGSNVDQKYGTRARQVFEIFTQEFQAAGKAAQLCRVLSNQAANSSKMEEAITTAGSQFDVLAIAPYFGTSYGYAPNPIPSFSDLASDTHTKFPEVRSWLNAYKALSQRIGKPLVCYEGGQHYVGIWGQENNHALTQQLVLFNREPVMAQLYTTYLNDLANAGIQLFCNFSLAGRFSKWGSWGCKEYWAQNVSGNRGDAVKLWAIENFFAQPPSGGGGSGGGGTGGSSAQDIALNKPASASSVEPGNTPDKANDGSNATRWAASSGAMPQWWEVDLESSSTITGLELVFEGPSKWKYRVEARALPTDSWTLLVDQSANSVHAQTYTHSVGTAGTGKRYVRVTILGYEGGYFWASLWTIKVLGSQSGSSSGNGNPGAGQGSGSITRDVWSDIAGTSIMDIPLGASPTTTGTLSSLEAPTNVADNYGQRLEGYLHPSTSGSYTFWIAGDDSVELWLSPSDQSSNAVRIAYHNGWTSPREWNKYPTQKSAPVNLAAGQRYYIRVLMKEGGGGDNLAVSWRLNTTDPANGDGSFIVPGSALSPRGTNGNGSSSPQAVSVETYDPPAAKSGVTHRLFSESTASAGSCAVLEGSAVGHQVTYAVPNVNAGTYTLYVRFKRANNRAIFQVASSDTLSGSYTNRGSPIDAYQSSMSYTEVAVGTVTFGSSGTKFIRFTATGKNSSSSSYWIAIDRIRLQP